MRAALYRRTGDAADVLSVEEIDLPEPGPGQVRVRITRSGINPTDWKTRAGLTGHEPEDFQVPHQDGAGVVDAVGEGVTSLASGQRVWLQLAAAFGNVHGTAAEYAVVPAERAAPLPDGATDDLGACLGVPAVTAAHCLLVGGTGGPAALAGRTVLVAGGAGAVGHYAIELAKHAGARVVTTVSSNDKGELARAAGADVVVNYREDGAVDRVRDAVGHADRIVEVALGANVDIDLAVAGAGTVTSVYANEPTDPELPVRRFMVSNSAIHFVYLYGVPADQRAAATGWTVDALTAGALTALPVTTYALDDVVAAHEAVQANTVGKVVLTP